MVRSGVRRVLVAAVAVVTVSVATGLAVASGGTASAAVIRGAGYVWANNASSELGTWYTPMAQYQYNSASPFTTINTVKRMTPGAYAVRFPFLYTDGVAHVTAYGGDTATCNLAGIVVVPDGTEVWVHCFTSAGAITDHQFTVTYTNVRASYENRPMAFLTAQGGPNGILPDFSNFNSSGAVNTKARTGVGTYTLRLPNLAAAGGHVQVTAWAEGRRCKTAGWGANGADQMVYVVCSDRTGARADTDFTMTYVERLNMLGLTTGFDPDGNESAYAWANQSTAASYQPNTFYQFDDFTNTAATGTRSGVGVYGMTFAYANLSVGDVQVTAYGTSSAYCGVAYWNSGSAGIQVRCYTATGTPTDTPYDVAFTGPFVIG
jgi:hypothetical protein